jgi:hypothetical protein
MRVPHIPSHDGNQRVQKELWEKWSRGRAEKAEGGPSLELMFRDSPRIETVRAKQSQRWYRTPPLSLSFQISGTWYLDSIASDNMTRIEENGDLRLFIRNIKLLNNGSLQFDFHFMCVLPPTLKLGENMFPCPTGTSYTHTSAHLGQCVDFTSSSLQISMMGSGGSWPVAVFCAPLSELS